MSIRNAKLNSNPIDNPSEPPALPSRLPIRQPRQVQATPSKLRSKLGRRIAGEQERYHRKTQPSRTAHRRLWSHISTRRCRVTQMPCWGGLLRGDLCHVYAAGWVCQ